MFLSIILFIVFKFVFIISFILLMCISGPRLRISALKNKPLGQYFHTKTSRAVNNSYLFVATETKHLKYMWYIKCTHFFFESHFIPAIEQLRDVEIYAQGVFLP